MARMAGVVLAGALLATGGMDAALAADAASTWTPRRPPPPAHAVTARAHLIYRPTPDDPPLEAEVTVIEARPADWNAATAGVLMAPCLIRHPRASPAADTQGWRCTS
ncbi:hypothetical protein [Phenylobacterium sp.]|uniref:hypothetical protein n=1 Tax=Phenylobacterium sp. TaxID=1871053 RepID=UPI002DF4BF3E|nr:hypothetical protein [Phenylobacterium sp.]